MHTVCSLLFTGSYNNFFRVFERDTHRETTFEASRLEMHAGVQLHARRIAAAQAGAAGAAAGSASTPGSTPSGSPALGKKGKKGPSPLGASASPGAGAAGSAMEVEQQAPLAVSVESLNLARKILHMACHPGENILAVAATNNLYIFQNSCGASASAPATGTGSLTGCGALALDDAAAAAASGTGAGRRCGSRHGSRSNSLVASQSQSREHSPVSRATAAAASGAGAASASASASANVFNAMHSRPLHESEPMSIP